MDDVLDVTQTSEQLGKTAGKDTAAEKVTYPALYGIDESAEEGGCAGRVGNCALERFRKRAETLKDLAQVPGGTEKVDC